MWKEIITTVFGVLGIIGFFGFVALIAHAADKDVNRPLPSTHRIWRRRGTLM